ncbi:MAG: DUF3782 domain-containing protein [Anaerolineales bacterium]
MSEIDYSEFREILKKELPRMIREHPETRYEVFTLLMEVTPPRPDVITQFEEFQQKWAERDRQFSDFQAETGQRFDRLEGELQEFRSEVNERFERVDEHLERVDEHLERVDERLERVDEHLERVDEHLERVDERLEQIDHRFEQVDQRFEQIDRRFEQVDQRFDGVDDRFDRLERMIDRLGARWGIRSESVFRQTIETLLEDSFGAKVQSLMIEGEQFDVVITNGHHILVEITASASKNIQTRLERKRDLYTQVKGIKPTRFILATSAIHSRRAESLRAAGFDVIEPELEEE